jgi:uncharacterized membrane protein (UPF0136 family)
MLRRLIIGLPAKDRIFTSLSLALVLAILVEVFFLRIFARAGIYIFRENPAEWQYSVYNSLTWLGSAALNFAAILAPLLLFALGIMLWQRKSTVFRLTATVLLVNLALGSSLFLVHSSPGLSLAYFGSSILLVCLAVSLYWKGNDALLKAPTFVPLFAMFLASYWYRIVPLLNQLGWAELKGPLVAFQLSEAMILLVSVSLLITVGISRSLKVLAVSIILPIILTGMYIGNPDMIPLISTWAFGVIMYLPFWVYIVALWSGLVVVLTLLERGQTLLAFAFILLFGSHRMLPLIYLNTATLLALIIIATSSWLTPVILKRWQLQWASVKEKLYISTNKQNKTRTEMTKG